MKQLLMIVMVLFSSQAIAETDFFRKPSEEAACVVVPPVKRKPSKAYLEKMQRLKDLEKEVKELREAKQQLTSAYEKVSSSVVYVKEPHLKRDSVSLLAGAAPTNLETAITPASFSAKSTYELDLGLAYQHDFDDWRASVGMFMHGSAFLGAGLRF